MASNYCKTQARLTRFSIIILILSFTMLSSPFLRRCEGARWKPVRNLQGFGNSSLSSSKLVREDEDVELSHHGLRDPKFSSINRRKLGSCNDSNSYLSLSISASDSLQDVQNVTVTVSGVLKPSDSDWIAVFSPSTADTNDCPLNKALYYETGDTSSQPLTCLYPVKYQFVSADPQYLSCGNSQCQNEVLDQCLVKTCNGSVTFRIINIRTDVVFVLFTGGLDVPCVLETSNALSFANPSSPLYGHLSSLDSTGTSMRLTWVSGDGNPQELYYNGESSTSTVSTFNKSQFLAQLLKRTSKFESSVPLLQLS
jgi:hypothetical protein